MGWFRRETLNEKLLREAGLAASTDEPPEPLEPRPAHEFIGAFSAAGLTGIARSRQWDTVVSAEAPELRGNEVEFVVLPDGSVIVEREEGDAQLDPLANAVEEQIGPPYRAVGVRKTETLWAVSARRIEVARFEAEGDQIELTRRADETTLTVDGDRVFGSLSALEALGERMGEDYAVRAQRIDDELWEVRTEPL